MKIVIDIPREFEEHFNQDAFEDTFHRLSADAHLLAGRYEQETAIMLIEAFKHGTVLPKGHGRLIDAHAMIDKHGDWYTEEGSEVGFIGSIKMLLNEQPTIIAADTEVEK